MLRNGYKNAYWGRCSMHQLKRMRECEKKQAFNNYTVERLLKSMRIGFTAWFDCNGLDLTL